MPITPRLGLFAVVLGALLAYTTGVQSAELKKLEWQQGASGSDVALHFDFRPRYSVETIPGENHYRLIFAGTKVNSANHSLSGRGNVASVVATQNHDTDIGIVDILLNKPGEIKLVAEPFGYRVITQGGDMEDAAISSAPSLSVAAVAENMVASTADTVMAQADDGESNAIHTVRFDPLPGGRMQVNIQTSGEMQEPGTFKTDNPPRLALDFFNTQNHVGRSLIPVGQGAIESISVVETQDRTRVVLNLLSGVPYRSELRPNELVLVVESPSEGAAPPQPKVSVFDKKSQDAEHQLTRVDFRRSENGGGRIVVDLSDPRVVVDVKQKDNEIVADFLETGIDQSLEKRLNVVDFATPVNTVDTFANGANTRMVITSTGRYSHLAYQTGNTFTIQVSPVIEDEEEIKTDEFGYSGERLSLNFQKIGVREALGVLADFTGLNFVTSDTVEGDLTLRLQDVPWDQALDLILQSKGLAKREKGNVIWVAPAQEIEAREQALLEAQQKVIELEPLVSELIQVNYAKAKDIEEVLKSIQAVDTGVQQSLFGSVSIQQVETESNSLLSPRGNVTVDERTNSILIQDTASKIVEVRKLIAKLDRPVRQVMIETRIVEANDDFSRTLGARLGFTRVTEDAQFPGVAGSDIGDVFISGNIENTNEVRDENETIIPDNLSVNLPAASINDNPAGSLAFTISKVGDGFAHLIDLEISALQAEGEGKIIANPRLVTADQKQAHIEQGQERIFTTSVLGVGSVVTKKAVLGLTVTPQITPDDRLVLDVFITQDAFVSPVDPTINTKQIQTQVLLDNGETVVIGGIYQQTLANEVAKVPILGDIPLVGNLFKTKSKRDNRTELLVFLTPKILSPALNL